MPNLTKQQLEELTEIYQQLNKQAELIRDLFGADDLPESHPLHQASWGIREKLDVLQAFIEEQKRNNVPVIDAGTF